MSLYTNRLPCLQAVLQITIRACSGYTKQYLPEGTLSRFLYVCEHLPLPKRASHYSSWGMRSKRIRRERMSMMILGQTFLNRHKRSNLFHVLTNMPPRKYWPIVVSRKYSLPRRKLKLQIRRPGLIRRFSRFWMQRIF
jgi:hypothetical protein